MRAVALLLACTLALAACGKVGPLRLPPADEEQARTATPGTPG